MKWHFIARDRFGKASDLVAVPREVIRRNGMTIPRRRLGEKIEESRPPVAAATFGYQTKCVLDQLRGIKMNKPLRP